MTFRSRHGWIVLFAEADDGTSGGSGGGAESPAADIPASSDAGEGAPAAPEPETVHDALTRAFDQAESQETEQPGEQPRADRARDEQGRFLPASQKPPGEQPPVQSVQRQQPGQQPGQPQPTALKPPSSWTPAAREQWSKLTPAVQQEVVRRENETGRALQESAQARGMVQEFSGILSPYAHNIQASGLPATEMIKQLFDADNGLRHSTPLHKAQILANIISAYGVDIQMLDNVLAGQAPPDDPQQRLLDQLRGEFARQLQPMNRFMQSFQGRQQQVQENLRAEVAGEVEEMSQREHFQELREDMADLLESHAKRGLTMTMEQAYDRALRLHPTLYETVARQNDQQRAQRSREAAQRARAAAISRPSGAPAGHGAPAGPAGDSVRDALVAAFDAHADGA